MQFITAKMNFRSTLGVSCDELLKDNKLHIIR